MKYWLRYSKTELLRYVGHLDMLHHWERILRRAELPLAFSQGFSPHPLISLAAPLPVGQESQAEYLELELREPMEPAALLAAIGETLPAGLRAARATTVPAATKPIMGLVRYADYQLRGPQVADMQPTLQEFLSTAAFTLTVMRKGVAKEVDIRPLVRAASINSDILTTCLATGSTGNLRPEDLIRALHADVPIATMRKELYLQLGDQLVTPWRFLGVDTQ